MGDFTMPSLGADMEAGTLVAWKVKQGDTVRRGDIVAVVETQKGAIDVEVFEDGRVAELLVAPGTKVPVGTVLARLDGAGPAMAPPPPPSPPRARASPGARTLAHERGVDLASVRGTGPAGTITREDVEHATGRAVPVHPGMRQAIADAMARSKREIPHYYLSTAIDLGPLAEWLRRKNEQLRPAERLLLLAPLLKAVALAAVQVPEVNGLYEHGAFHPAGQVHLGVAVSLREGGVVTPALHDVAGKAVDVIGRELADLVERARRGQLKSSELSDGTLTVTSLGERGVETVFGVIYPPQVALVGLGKVTETPRVVGGQCVSRPVLVATLAADHRVSDGHRGGRFLSELDALLQHPEAL